MLKFEKRIEEIKKEQKTQKEQIEVCTEAAQSIMNDAELNKLEAKIKSGQQMTTQEIGNLFGFYNQVMTNNDKQRVEKINKMFGIAAPTPSATKTATTAQPTTTATTKNPLNNNPLNNVTDKFKQFYQNVDQWRDKLVQSGGRL